jgi:hypothetical protein
MIADAAGRAARGIRTPWRGTPFMTRYEFR